MLIFSTQEVKYFWYLPEKSKFSFYFFRKEKKINLFSWSFLVNFAWLSAFSRYNIGYKHSLPLENGL